MTCKRQNDGLAGFVCALMAGLQWRMLLIWLLLMLIPVAIAAWPMSAELAGLLDHMAGGKAWADNPGGFLLGDAMVQLGHAKEALGATAGLMVLVSLLLAPFLTGMAVSDARAPAKLGFGDLMHGGLHEYWRMVRVLLWSLTGWAVAFGIGRTVMNLADKHAEQAVLQSDADLWSHLALAVAGIVLVLAHAATESARAQFAADPNLTSATRAWGRGLKAVFTRPLPTLGAYVAITIIGLVLVLIFGMLRARMPAVGGLDSVLAIVLAQLVVLSLAWMRIARIHALARTARRRGAGPRFAGAPSMDSMGYTA